MTAVPRSGKATCNCGACPIDPAYWPEAPSEVTRQIAWGINGGGWCCDCMDWDAEDATVAYARRVDEEMRMRDILRAGLKDIALHADLDASEQGVVEASRYAVIARDTIRKAGLQ